MQTINLDLVIIPNNLDTITEQKWADFHSNADIKFVVGDKPVHIGFKREGVPDRKLEDVLNSVSESRERPGTYPLRLLKDVKEGDKITIVVNDKLTIIAKATGYRFQGLEKFEDFVADQLNKAA